VGLGVEGGANYPEMAQNLDLYCLGIDFGTSGARAVLIDGDRQPCWSYYLSFNAYGDFRAV